MLARERRLLERFQIDPAAPTSGLSKGQRTQLALIGAIAAEPEIGLLLPCNVVVRAIDDATTGISFMDPEAILQLVDQPGIDELAADVKARLLRVMAAVSTD